jgi:hypothetical protein
MTRRWSSGARPGKPAAQHLGKIQTALMGSIAPVLTDRPQSNGGVHFRFPVARVFLGLASWR